MAYRFKSNESIPENIYRIVTEQTEMAAAELYVNKADVHHNVHNARKCFKKIRCIIRLVRDDLGSQIYQHENKYFRNAGRQLSTIRDAEVMIHTWDRLMLLYPRMTRLPLQLALKNKLQLRHKRIILDEPNLTKQAFQISGELRHTPERIKTWPLSQSGFKVLKKGLKRSYRKGRQALKLARQKPTDENLHEWRKQAKDYWYHSRLLQSCRPGAMSKRIAKLKALTEFLGDDHDLSVLQQTLILESDQFEGDISYALDCAQKYQKLLRKKAFKLGRILYQNSPAAYIAKIKIHWKTWKQ